jgi:hypothetical protein
MADTNLAEAIGLIVCATGDYRAGLFPLPVQKMTLRPRHVIFGLDVV